MKIECLGCGKDITNGVQCSPIINGVEVGVYCSDTCYCKLRGWK